MNNNKWSELGFAQATGANYGGQVEYGPSLFDGWAPEINHQSNETPEIEVIVELSNETERVTYNKTKGTLQHIQYDKEKELINVRYFPHVEEVRTEGREGFYIEVPMFYPLKTSE